MNRMRDLGWCVLAVVALLSACGKNEQELLASAKAQLQKKDARAASIELKTLLQANPSSAEARFLLGRSLLEQGDTAGAEIELRRAQEFQHPEVLVAPLLSKALLGLGQHDKLVAQFAGAQLGDAAADAELQTNVAQAHLALGNTDAAVAALDKALQRAPQFAPALIVSARMKAGSGDIDGALALLDGLLAAAPGTVSGWQAKGDLLVTGKQDLAAAIDAYRKGLEVAADSAALHAALISLHFAQQDRPAAQQQFELMKKLLPEHGLTRYHTAQFAVVDGDFKRARELLQVVLRAAPENVGALHLAGAAELQLNSLAQAEAYLSKAVALQGGFVGARKLLAKVHLRAKQPAKAIAVLRPLLEGNDADADTLTLAGQVFLLTNDAKSADLYFARAAKLNSADPQTRTTLALAQLGKGRGDVALAELASIAQTDPGVVANMALVSARLQRRDFDGALAAIDALERKQPESALAPELRGRVHLQQQEMPLARKSFEAALTKDAKHFPAVANLAALDLLERKPDEARARFEQLLKIDPKSVQAYLALAELKSRTGGSAAEVAKLIGDAIAADPSDVQPRLVLIEHHLAANDAKSAVAAAQAAVAALPGDAVLQERLARALMRAGDNNQAQAVFGKLAAQQPESALGPLGLAELAVGRSDFESASRHARRALEVAPASLQAQRLSILVAMRQGRPQDAVAVARAMQAQRADDAMGYILEGEIEADQKRWNASAVAFRKALATPNPLHAASRLHAILLKGGKAAEAARFGDTWLAKQPGDMLFLLHLGDMAAAQGDLPLAERRYAQAVAAQPQNPMALSKAAWSLTQQKKPGAVSLAERALAAAPGQSALLDGLSLALASEGQHARAIEHQKKLVTQAPQAPMHRLTLAKIYLQAGDKVSARAELEAIQKQGRDFVGKDEAEQLLKAVSGA